MFGKAAEQKFVETIMILQSVWRHYLRRCNYAETHGAVYSSHLGYRNGKLLERRYAHTTHVRLHPTDQEEKTPPTKRRI
ncbi:hypothetical protein NECAME_16710 [Necator americanus]|uniref:Uncharacterized protein n=1 Tax=Necator americanus TaxID=51031 RepID=W2TU72_NECAM|nr:hypothetical protein NECAME_16710 [Necator americanus]ETN85640.1 hypothetical protein NECAME_16710 [Necator americanus]